MLDYLLQLVMTSLILGSAATVIAYLAAEAGILHVASAGVMGVGAYTAALSSKQAVSVEGGVVLALFMGIAVGAAVDGVTHYLDGAYLAMATLGVTVVLHGVMTNWISLTGGPMGITNIPAFPPVLGINFFWPLALTVILVGMVAWLPRTSFGLRVRALRDDRILSDDLSLRPRGLQSTLIIGSSCILSILGALYAYHLRFIDPSSFALRESIAVLAMALVVPAPLPLKGLAGGALFVFLPELLRFVGFSPAVGAELRQVLFGLCLLLVVMTRRTPTGILTDAAV